MIRRLPGVQTRDDWPAVAGGTRGKRGVIELGCDVAVVGSGAGGAVVAAELAEGGHDVMLLEEGGYHTTDEFTVEASAMVRMLYRDGGLVLALGLPPVLYAEGRCVGGSTTVNGGMTWRTPERILQRWEREHGLAGVTGSAMERIFERVERFTSATTQDPGTVGRDNQLLREGAGRLGWRVIDNIRNQKHCAGTNNCAFGCPTGAKQSTLVSYVPRALHFGARLYADCRVDRLLRRGVAVVGADRDVRARQRLPRSVRAG
jgi:choline dehydrogenase-like flavoprotein